MCRWERNISNQIEIPYLLMVFLSILFDKLPYSFFKASSRFKVTWVWPWSCKNSKNKQVQQWRPNCKKEKEMLWNKLALFWCNFKGDYTARLFEYLAASQFKDYLTVWTRKLSLQVEADVIIECRHSLISISAIFYLPRFITLSYFPPL